MAAIACQPAALLGRRRTVGRRRIDGATDAFLRIVGESVFARVPTRRGPVGRDAFMKLVGWAAAIRAHRVAIRGGRGWWRVVERWRAKRSRAVALCTAHEHGAAENTREKSAHGAKRTTQNRPREQRFTIAKVRQFRGSRCASERFARRSPRSELHRANVECRPASRVRGHPPGAKIPQPG